MMFEVDKKYQKKLPGAGSVSSSWSDPYTCIAVFMNPRNNSQYGWLDTKDSYYPESYAFASHEWREYQEPRSLTRWTNVWQNSISGEIIFGTSFYNTKKGALEAADTSIWKRLDVIEVKWTEKK